MSEKWVLWGFCWVSCIWGVGLLVIIGVNMSAIGSLLLHLGERGAQFCWHILARVREQVYIYSERESRERKWRERELGGLREVVMDCI